MFLGLPDPLVRYMDPDPSIIKKNIDSFCFVFVFDFFSMKIMYMYRQKVEN